MELEILIHSLNHIMHGQHHETVEVEDHHETVEVEDHQNNTYKN
jgi:hypothetical protein